MNAAEETISMLQILLDEAKESNTKDTHISDVKLDSFEFVIKQAMFIIASQGELIKGLMEDEEISKMIYKKCKTDSSSPYGSIVNNTEI